MIEFPEEYVPATAEQFARYIAHLKQKPIPEKEREAAEKFLAELTREE